MDQLLRQADALLYQAKQAGKDRVVEPAQGTPDFHGVFVRVKKESGPPWVEHLRDFQDVEEARREAAVGGLGVQAGDARGERADVLGRQRFEIDLTHRALPALMAELAGLSKGSL